MKKNELFRDWNFVIAIFTVSAVQKRVNSVFFQH